MVILNGGHEPVGRMAIEGDAMTENFGSLVIIVIPYNDNSMTIVNPKLGVEPAPIACASVNKTALTLISGLGFHTTDHGDGIAV